MNNIVLIPIVILGVGVIVNIMSYSANSLLYFILGIVVVAILLNFQDLVFVNLLRPNINTGLDVIGIVSLSVIVILYLFPKSS